MGVYNTQTIAMENNNNMDDEGSKQKKTCNSIADDSDVLPPSGVRCSILHAPKTDKFLCSYHLIFLPCISIIFWSVFILFGN